MNLLDILLHKLHMINEGALFLPHLVYMLWYRQNIIS